MNFQTVRDSLISLLGASQGTIWKTIGFAERDQSAKENHALRTAQVYYNRGTFPMGRSSAVGPVQHQMEFKIILTVAAKSKGDLTALDEAETAEEFIAANATFTRSEETADREMDDFIDEIWKVLMSADNRNLGIVQSETIPNVSNRWIPDVRKEEPKQKGNFCTMRAAMTLQAQIAEDVIGIDTSGLPEYETIPFSGTDAIKDNVPQSGNLSPGEPVSNPL